MNLIHFINSQQTAKDTDLIKIQLLKSISELLLMPNVENTKNTLKYLGILAKSFYIPISKTNEIEKTNDIDKTLLYKTSVLIQNKQGYIEIIPNLINTVLSFAKHKNIEI